MKIAIIAAMQEEFAAFRKFLVPAKENNIFDISIVEGTLSGKQCILAKSGIGKVNAARTAQYLVDNCNPNLIISIGSAGALSEELNYGDVVVGSGCIQFDFDLTVFGREIGYIPDSGRLFSCDNSLIEKANKLSPKAIGNIITADSFVNDPDEKHKLHNEFNAICDDMESASCAQVCHHAHLPFISIRAVSDKPKEKAKVDFYSYLNLAAENAAEFAMKLISEV